MCSAPGRRRSISAAQQRRRGPLDLSQIGSGLQYDGFSTFNKVGASRWILTGVGTQDWSVFGGLLTVNGTLNGQVTVSNSALEVYGTINGPVSVTGGTLDANGGTINGAVALNTSTFTTSGTVNGGVIVTNGAMSQTGGTINGNIGLSNSTFSITNGTVNGAVTMNNGVLTQSGGLLNGDVSLTGSLFTMTNGTLRGALTVNNGTIAQNGGVIDGAVVLTTGGMFTANGTVTGPVTIGAGVTLGGNGSLGSTTINGGTLAPGNSIGTLSVQGNLTLSSASTYLVEIDATASDRTLVAGTASLAGTVQALFATGAFTQRNYAIITTGGGRSGTFGALSVSNLPRGLPRKPDVRSDQRLHHPHRGARDADTNANSDTNSDTNADADATPTPSPPVTLLNQNQQNVATSLNNYFNNGGALPARFVEVFRLTGDSLRSALSQLSGETATQSAQAAFSSVDYFINTMLDPFVTGRSGSMAADGSAANNFASEETDANAYAAKRGRSATEQDAYAAMARKAVARNNLLDPRWSVWGGAYGGALKSNGNAAVGARDASTRAFGFAAGADYRVSPNTLVGFAMSGGGTSFSLAQVAGSGRSDVFQAGAFVRHTIGQAYVKGAIAYGWHDVTTNRTVAVAGNDRLDGRYNANSFAARGEAGYRFATPWMGLTPYAAAQSITYVQSGYGEQANVGLNTFALNYASRDVTSARTEVGLRADRSFALQSALVTLRSRAAWAHYFDDSRSLTAGFQTLAGTSFVVTGAAQARDAALMSASADVKWMNGISLAGVFEGEFSGQTQGYGGKGIVRYSW